MKIRPEVQIALKAAQNDFQLAPAFDITPDICMWCLSADNFQHCAVLAITRNEIEANTHEGLRELINQRFDYARRTICNTERTKEWWK